MTIHLKSRALGTSALTLGLLVIMAVLYVPAAVAKRPTCLIVNTSSGGRYETLQAAQDAATVGDTIKVKGTCVGTTTITKNLTITGQANPAFGTPTLDGNEIGCISAEPGICRSVLGISSGATATVDNLTLTGGSADGGGIQNRGTLTLNHTTVTGNEATFGDAGGGILNFEGTLTLNNSTVTGNTSTAEGGGIDNLAFPGTSATLTLNHSLVSDNSAPFGGGIVNNGGTVALTDSTVTGNLATIFGGGILNNTGTVTLTNSTVSGNTPDDCVGC